MSLTQILLIIAAVYFVLLPLVLTVALSVLAVSDKPERDRTLA